ncbi:MAG TPA: sodium:solute symporter family protein, partial [Vicinamibacteria bacterium]|nr:sodium:solute symporter family protein [Vicinamibacteria bacterium]
MTQALIVIAYLAIVVYIGVFAFRRKSESRDAEGYFLAGRSLGPVVFLLSLFGTNMTAFAILGSSGHAFQNGIVTYGLMASSSGLVIPLTIFLVGTRVWALGKRHGFMTPVQLFRDRWECNHIGTVIFALQAVLLVPYIIIGVMGGGTTLAAVSGGWVPYWLGGLLVALVVMSYVFF